MTGISASPPTDPLQVRLDLLRGEALIQLEILSMLIDLGKAYLTMPQPHDEGFVGAMADAKDRFKLALARTADLQRERNESAITGAAAEEWRAQREGRRA